MTSRSTVTSLFALLASFTIAAASCGDDGKSSSAPPPSQSTGVSVTSGDTTVTTGAGGSGGGGTGGMGGGSPASCMDTLTNGKETAKDCGGPDCPPCSDNLACKTSADCASHSCDPASLKCAPASCMDTVKNGTETDKDCGGGGCAPCSDNLACKLGTDCISQNCEPTSLKCMPISCKDGVKNGAETDLDCGGNCPSCGYMQACIKSTDCKGASCISNICVESCIDGVKSGSKETDVDCGGGFCPPCSSGLKCGTNEDCKDKLCNAMSGTCNPALCTDSITNGNETDIDCGGAGCPQCAVAQKCKAGSDCLSQSCDLSLGKCACPAGMQPVPKKLGGGSYCIDTTEVTYAQYKVFYSANPILTLPTGCPGAGSYTPSGSWPAGPTTLEQQQPVSHVDWCDAYAYCLYSGKHLCGKVDEKENDPLDSADASKSEWYNACSAQGASVYPYGSTYDNTKCDGVDRIVAGTPAGTCAGDTCGKKVGYDLNNVTTLICQGGVPNVWGMSGNLAEWENSCDGATPPSCLVRGGSRCEAGSSIACNAGVSQPRTYKGCDVGFRCCF